MIKCNNPCPIDKFEGCCFECDLKETCIEVCGFNPLECDDSIMMNDMFQVGYLKEKKKKEELVVEKQPDKMQIEKIMNLNKQLNEDIGKLQIENNLLLAENNLLQEENEKLKADLRDKDNEINELKERIAYLKQLKIYRLGKDNEQYKY